MMCFQVLIDWINSELEEDRIIVKDLEEDCYDGQVLQKLFGKKLVSLASQLSQHFHLHSFWTPSTWSCMKICNIISRRKYIINSVGQHKVCWMCSMKYEWIWILTNNIFVQQSSQSIQKKVKVILKKFSILLAACGSSINKGSEEKTSFKRSSAHAIYVI